VSAAERVAVSITLSPAQVDEVLRAVSESRAPSLSRLIGDSLGDRRAPLAQALASSFLLRDTSNRRLSRSLLRGLSLLTCFGPRGEERGIVEIAEDLEMSPSTAHRYAVTLVELGLLERGPHTRKYRLPRTGTVEAG
jgi:DNA-binding transcriptional ArsR family regulator